MHQTNMQVVTHRAHASLQRAPQVLETQLPTSRYELCDTHIWETHMRDRTSNVNQLLPSFTDGTHKHPILWCTLPAFQASHATSCATSILNMCQHMLRMHPILMHCIHAIATLNMCQRTNMSKCWLTGTWNLCQLQSTHFRGNGLTNALFKGL